MYSFSNHALHVSPPTLLYLDQLSFVMVLVKGKTADFGKIESSKKIRLEIGFRTVRILPSGAKFWNFTFEFKSGKNLHK